MAMSRYSTELEFQIIHPERRMVSERWVVQQAQDHLAAVYVKANPGVDPASGAIEANSQVDGLEEAFEILHEHGLVTFTQASWDKMGEG